MFDSQVIRARELRNSSLGDDELANRRKGWKPNAPRYTSGVLAKYAKLVQGAETGAITNIIS
jgi:dihydroxy-acid dehydratase